MKSMTRMLVFGCGLLTSLLSFAERQGPWAKERAWEWYNDQPWIRGCNYMPASAANRVDQWQELGAEERFREVESELSLAETIGFNTLRIFIEEQGFGVWLADHDGFMVRFERMLAIMGKHGLRAIVVLGSDCSRPKELWKMPTPGPQTYDIGYHGGRRITQHGSNPKAVGYTVLDDPNLRPKFYAMCEELLRKYRTDERILFWNLWNEPGNNNRNDLTVKHLRELFEIAWRIDPKQPLAADLWLIDKNGNGRHPVEQCAAEWSDVISYHRYVPAERQKQTIAALRTRWDRPMICTEWLSRMGGDEPCTSYPAFAQEKVGCVCWGFVNGKYQTHEPYESLWKSQFEFSDPEVPVTKWFHDLFRPSHHPYDPEEIAVIRNVNAQMDAERDGQSMRLKIAKSHKITGEDLWYGYRRTKFDFAGREAWLVEPSVAPRTGRPWTWTMQWVHSFVDRTGALEMLKRGWHHVTIELFDTRMNDDGVATAAAFQKFLVDELGLAPKANLIGMSWGGFFSVRYATAHPESVRKIYLDAPLLTLTNAKEITEASAGPWAKEGLGKEQFATDPRMPVNQAERLAAAKIPVLLLYGGADTVVRPEINAEPFIARFKAAGGTIEVKNRNNFGHHPHGLDPDKMKPIVDFMSK